MTCKHMVEVVSEWVVEEICAHKEEAANEKAVVETYNRVAGVMVMEVVDVLHTSVVGGTCNGLEGSPSALVEVVKNKYKA